MSKKINIEFNNQNICIKQKEYFSLLIAMERNSLPVKYGCLMGVCGACEVKIVEGKENIEYFEDTIFETQGDSIYPCCCIAKGDVKLKDK